MRRSEYRGPAQRGAQGTHHHARQVQVRVGVRQSRFRDAEIRKCQNRKLTENSDPTRPGTKQRSRRIQCADPGIREAKFNKRCGPYTLEEG